MMTVKYITLSGEEAVFQTKHARFTPVKQGQLDDTPPTVWFEADNGVEHPLTGGTVFVMNDAGKTVARYDLGASMVPLSARNDPLPMQGMFGSQDLRGEALHEQSIIAQREAVESAIARRAQNVA